MASDTLLVAAPVIQEASAPAATNWRRTGKRGAATPAVVIKREDTSPTAVYAAPAPGIDAVASSPADLSADAAAVAAARANEEALLAKLLEAAAHTLPDLSAALQLQRRPMEKPSLRGDGGKPGGPGGPKPPHRRSASYTRREKAEEGAASCSDDEKAENEAQEVMGATEELCGGRRPNDRASGSGCGIRMKTPGTVSKTDTSRTVATVLFSVHNAIFDCFQCVQVGRRHCGFETQGSQG